MSTTHQNPNPVISIYYLQTALEHFAEALGDTIETATDEGERSRMVLAFSMVRDAISVLKGSSAQNGLNDPRSLSRQK
jgi:hypothetical protein